MARKIMHQKEWFEFEVDGKILGIMEDSKETQNEIKRLKSLKGVVIRKATNDSLIRFNAKTKIPSHIIYSWPPPKVQVRRV